MRTFRSYDWNSIWATGSLAHRQARPGLRRCLVAALPGLAEHGCSYREPGGFIRRMREGEGTWLGHVLEHVAIELQNVAGEDVTFGKTRSIDGRAGRVFGGLRVRAEGGRYRRGRTGVAPVAVAVAGRTATRGARTATGSGRARATSSSATRSAARWDRRPHRW
ncbi:MAG: hypothetical protein LKM39_07115 [Chiayiivirga sp.]|jgi:hypothetical protein|nr:hypothetical protein [Chiayiivirga sp.]